MTRLLTLIGALVTLSACGVASVSPFVTDTDLVDEPRLAGQWHDALGQESAVITAVRKGVYEIVHTDKEQKVGRFEGRLGRVGALRVLDIHPSDPLPAANDVYKSLLLRAHGVLIIDSVDSVLTFRMVQGDSLKAYLRRNPESIRHALIDHSVLFTGSTDEVKRFLIDFARQPGNLDGIEYWRRRKP